MKARNISIYLPGIYIFLIGFQEPYHLPWLNGKIQLSDLWFLVMLFYLFITKNTYLPILKNLIHDKGIQWFYLAGISYLFINGISVFHSFSTSGFVEIIGRCYLLIMSFVFLLFLIAMNDGNIPKSIFRFFNLFGLSLAVVGIVGWIFSISGIHNETTQIYLNYPYFGDTHRLKAFTATPSMYISMITICIMFGFCNYLFYQKNKRQLFSALFYTIVALLTFTKSFLFIIAGIIVLVLFKYYRNHKLISSLFLCFVILHVATTHFLVIPNKQMNDITLKASPYTSNEVIYSAKDFSIMASGYYTFKKTAWYLFTENSIFGTGLGNYNMDVAQLKEEGLYPQNLPNYDPHSTYLGVLAETGMIGFIALMFLGLRVLYFFFKLDVMKNPFSFSLLLIFCIMIVEGISMDTMNFRHYWVIVSIILFQYWNIKKETELVFAV